MVLPSSGQIGISNINTELGLSSTANLSLNDGRPRALAEKMSAGSQIKLTDFYGKRAPEYWWSANYGLSTSGWTAIRGGLNFTFYNVSSANSTTGVYFNGSNSYAATGNLPSNIDAKFIYMRFDTFNRTFSAMGGGSQNNIHEFNFYSGGGGGYWWYHIERLVGTLSYATRSTWNIGTYLITLDFLNSSPAGVSMRQDNSNVSYLHDVYDGLGTFNGRFRWEAGYNILLGRRQEGNYSSFYLKEFAIFTSNLSEGQNTAFRDTMLARWPA